MEHPKRMNLYKTSAPHFYERSLDEDSSAAPRPAPHPVSHPLPFAVGIIFFLLAAIVVGSVASAVIFAPADVGKGVERWSLFPFPNFSTFKKILLNEQSTDAHRVNILLLGMGGSGHEGPLLTDTIMIASVNTETKQAGLLSVPRDLSAKFPDGRWYKINDANAFGSFNQNYPNGADYTARIIENTFDLPIHYYVLIDFSGFEQFIDALGGIKVSVERSFTDTAYPTDDDKYQTISFSAGEQRFNGQQTLRFARSRHGNNGEGSDFARAKRQQLILRAVREKIMSVPFLINPKRILSTLDVVRSHITTNLETSDILRLASLAKSIDPERVNHVVPVDGPQGVLESITGIDGAYLLQPKGANYQLLRDLAAQLLDPPRENSVEKISGRIIVQNGTFLPGLAATVGTTLESAGFTIVRSENAAERSVEVPIIYDLTNGRNKTALERLEQLTAGRRAVPSDSFSPTDRKGIDFIIILGTKTKI